ncbi:MAG: RNA polymerase sigma factor [Planctomycetaceae bacterium]
MSTTSEPLDPQNELTFPPHPRAAGPAEALPDTAQTLSEIITYALRHSRFATMRPDGGIWQDTGNARLTWLANDKLLMQASVAYHRVLQGSAGNGEIEFEAPEDLLLLGQYPDDWKLPAFQGCSRTFLLPPTVRRDAPSAQSETANFSRVVAAASSLESQSAAQFTAGLDLQGHRINVQLTLPDRSSSEPFYAVLNVQYDCRPGQHKGTPSHAETRQSRRIVVLMEQQPSSEWHGSLDLQSLPGCSTEAGVRYVSVQLRQLLVDDLYLLPSDDNSPGLGAFSLATSQCMIPLSTDAADPETPGKRKKHRVQYSQPAAPVTLSGIPTEQEDNSRPRGSFPEQQTTPTTEIEPANTDAQRPIQQAIDLWNSGQKVQAITQIPELLTIVQNTLRGRFGFGKHHDLEDAVQDALLNLLNSNGSTEPFTTADEIKAYTTTTAKNAAMRILSSRRNASRHMSQLSTDEDAADFADSLPDTQPLPWKPRKPGTADEQPSTELPPHRIILVQQTIAMVDGALSTTQARAIISELDRKTLALYCTQTTRRGRSRRDIAAVMKKLSIATVLCEQGLQGHLSPDGQRVGLLMYYLNSDGGWDPQSRRRVHRVLHAGLLLNNDKERRLLLSPQKTGSEGNRARTDGIELVTQHVCKNQPLEAAWEQIAASARRPLDLLLPIVCSVWAKAATGVASGDRGPFENP